MTSDFTLRHFLTARDGNDRLTEKSPISPCDATQVTHPSVFVDPGKPFQTIEGFGGAFTEAAATTFYKLSSENQKTILQAYFDDAGLGYTLGRTHINSCDFSLGNYAYADVDGDMELKSFSIERDRQALVPMIQAALKTARGTIKLLACPWSPPAWMKTSGTMNQGGKLKPECRDAWAQYYVRYIREYEKENVSIWGLTTQNEPAAKQSWDSCLYTAVEEKDFIRDHLGPALEKAGLGHVKIVLWDHNREYMVHRAAAAYSDPVASKYIWGTGYHWYCDDKFENMNLHHDAWPDKPMLFTEGCQEGGPHTGEWTLGERYARSMINDFNRWCVGWIDWNLLLDEQGGPNHVGNFCSAPILGDTKQDQVLFQSSYYYIGHFSRFVKPGARRVLCASTHDKIETAAFIHSGRKLTVVIMNRTEQKYPCTLEIAGNVSFRVDAAPRSISTYLAELG